MDLECIETDYPSTKALRKAAGEFEVCIRNNAWMIPTMPSEGAMASVIRPGSWKAPSRRWWASALASVSRCGGQPGAHLMLQTRMHALDGTLREKFEQWYPRLKNDDAAGKAEPLAA